MLFSSLLGVTGMFLAARLQPELAIFLILKQLVQLYCLALLFGAPDASRQGIEGLQGKYPRRRNDGSSGKTKRIIGMPGKRKKAGNWVACIVPFI